MKKQMTSLLLGAAVAGILATSHSARAQQIPAERLKNMPVVPCYGINSCKGTGQCAGDGPRVRRGKFMQEPGMAGDPQRGVPCDSRGLAHPSEGSLTAAITHVASDARRTT